MVFADLGADIQSVGDFGYIDHGDLKTHHFLRAKLKTAVDTDAMASAKNAPLLWSWSKGKPGTLYPKIDAMTDSNFKAK